MKKLKWLTLCGSAGVIALVALSWFDESPHTAVAQTKVVNQNEIIASDCAVALIDTALLAADRPGVLEFLELEDGDDVGAGQKVAGLKDGVARSALATATEKARNDVQERYALKATQFADKELEIANSANSRLPGTVPDLEVQKLKLGAERGLLQVEQAQFERIVATLTQKEAEENLKTYDIYAPPYDCKVSKVLKKRGESVRQGDPILEVISAARMKVEGYVSTRDSYRLKPGDAVVVIPKDVPDSVIRDFKGIVKFIDQRIVGGKVLVTAYVENSNEILKDGLNATMKIKTTPDPGLRPAR